MEKEKNEVHIRGKKCRIEFTRLIGTWAGGGGFVQCEYKGIFEEETVILHLRIVAESSEYREMGKPSQDEIDNRSFVRSEEGQEKFFGGKGKEIVTETLSRLGGIEGVRRAGCGQIRDCYVPHSEIATVIIRSIKKRN